MLPSPMGFQLRFDNPIGSISSNRGLQPFRGRMRFKVSLVNIQNEENIPNDEWEQPHVQEDSSNDEWEHPYVQENILNDEWEQPHVQENIPNAGMEQPHVRNENVVQENIPNAGMEQPRVGNENVVQEIIPNAGMEQPHVGNENVVQENIPNAGMEQSHVGNENVVQENIQNVGVEQPHLVQQQGAESSVLRGNIEEIKMNIAQKELDIKREKETLRVVDNGLDCLSKATVLLNLLSSNVPLEQNPLDVQSSMSSKIRRLVKDLFGTNVPAVAESFHPSYNVIGPLMVRLSPGFELCMNPDGGIYFIPTGEHVGNLIPLKGMLAELEQLKLQKEVLEKRLQEVQQVNIAA